MKLPITRKLIAIHLLFLIFSLSDLLLAFCLAIAFSRAMPAFYSRCSRFLIRFCFCCKHFLLIVISFYLTQCVLYMSPSWADCYNSMFAMLGLRKDWFRCYVRWAICCLVSTMICWSIPLSLIIVSWQLMSEVVRGACQCLLLLRCCW